MAETSSAGALMELLALIRASQDRTAARRQLRGACDTVAATLVRHLRAGDQARVGEALYKVAAVTWPVRDPEDPTRVRAARPTNALLRNGLILHDVRRAATDRAPAVGHRFAHTPPTGEPVWDLHLASDQDACDFAAEVGEVIVGFRRHLQADAEAFRGAVERAVTGLLEQLPVWEGLASPTPPQRRRRGAGIPSEWSPVAISSTEAHPSGVCQTGAVSSTVTGSEASAQRCSPACDRPAQRGGSSSRQSPRLRRRPACWRSPPT